MFDPNNPQKVAPPGQMQIMGQPQTLGGFPAHSGGVPGGMPPMPGGFPQGGAGRPAGGGMPPMGGGMPPPPGMPPMSGQTAPGYPGGPTAPSAGGGGAFGGMLNNPNLPPQVRAILEALQGFRAERQAWVEGGRVGDRPMRPDLQALMGTLGHARAAVPGAVQAPGAPQGIAVGEPNGSVGTSLSVNGMVPPTSGFELPTY